MAQDAVQDAHGEEGQREYDGDEHPAFATGDLVEVTRGDHGEEEEPDVDKDEKDDADSNFGFARFLVGRVGGSLVTAAGNTEKECDGGGKVDDLDNAAAASDCSSRFGEVVGSGRM